MTTRDLSNFFFTSEYLVTASQHQSSQKEKEKEKKQAKQTQDIFIQILIGGNKINWGGKK